MVIIIIHGEFMYVRLLMAQAYLLSFFIYFFFFFDIAMDQEYWQVKITTQIVCRPNFGMLVGLWLICTSFFFFLSIHCILALLFMCSRAQ